MTRASGSANRTGAQSAASAPSTSPGILVTRASAFGSSLGANGSVTIDGVGAVDLMAGQQPVAANAQVAPPPAHRFSSTRARSSFEPTPQLSEP